MKKKSRLLFSIFILIATGCLFSENSKKIELTSINDISKKVLGQTLENIRSSNFYYSDELLEFKDTMFYSEGESWKGLISIYKNKPLFILETSWLDINKITRLEILHPDLKTEDGISVSDNFVKLKPFVNRDSWKNFPDGCLYFSDIKDDNLIYVMDIANYSELGSQGINIDKLPENLLIEMIIIENK